MVEKFEVQLATLKDMKAVFDLSNDDLVRLNSFNSEKILWENHKEWFKTKINDENCIFYVIKNINGKLISQVRFDKNDNEATVSISITPEFRGQGYGVKILKCVSEKMVVENKIKKIKADIKIENKASKKIFEKAGYILKEKDSDKLRYEYNAI